MTDKTDTSFTIPEDNMPAILHVREEEKDPNWQDVLYRDRVKYLRERYWIKQWSPLNRWKSRRFANCAGQTEVRRADLGRKLDNPGDAFFDLFLFTSQYSVRLRTWLEVTEVFISDVQAEKVNKFIREYNGLRGKGEIDPVEFLRSLDLGPPDSRMQHEMADRVILAIKKKARKGQEGGSYKSLVRDYGRGQLIVGLPLWFATFPSDPTNPSIALTDFTSRLLLGFDAIKHSVLRASWCPFDSIIILWNPTLESIDAWVRAADPDFYLDPANRSWKTPISYLKMHTYLKKHNLPAPDSITCHVRWDRYTSLDDMLIDQRKWLRFPHNPRPLGPKACLDVRKVKTVIDSLRIEVYMWILQLWLFVRINGWCGLRRKIVSRFSVHRLYTRLRKSRQTRKLYRSSISNRSKRDENDHSDKLK